MMAAADYYEAARQLTTAVLHDDKAAARDIILRVDQPSFLAYSVACLAGGIHRAWCERTGENATELWEKMMLGIAIHIEENGT